MLWDPLSRCGSQRTWIWATFAIWVCVFRGPPFVANFRRDPGFVPNFFQDYASVRLLLDGESIYADQFVAARRYLHEALDPNTSYVVVNAHPPTSTLLFLPLARLTFDNAMLAWNLFSLSTLIISLEIVRRQLKIPFSAGSVCPLLALFLLCHPLLEEIRLGQLTLILTLLLTATWAAERSGRPSLAGALLATATAIKLFPGFLFIYFGLRGQWRLILSGLVTLSLLTAATIAIVGSDAYRLYVTLVLPEIHWFRVGWGNVSVWGFWSRLFDPEPERQRLRSLTTPLVYSPAIATFASCASSAVIVAVLATALRSPRAKLRPDLTFALASTVMLLLSPMAWDHYLLVLLVPLAVLWTHLPARRTSRFSFLAILFGLWISPWFVWDAFGLIGRSATPFEAATILSFQFYVLLALFTLEIVVTVRRDTAALS